MMKTWKNYANITFAKMQAAKENGDNYVFSDSQQIESEDEDSYFDHDDESPGPERYFDAQNSANNDLIEEEDQEFFSQNEKIKSGLIMDEEKIAYEN